MSQKPRRYWLHWPEGRNLFAPWMPEMPNPLPIIDGQWYYRYDLDEDRLPAGLRGRMRLAIKRNIPEYAARSPILPLGANGFPSYATLEEIQ